MLIKVSKISKKSACRWLIATSLIVCLIIIGGLLARTWAFWDGGISGDDYNSDNMINIGQWNTDTGEPGPTVVFDFNRVITELKMRDPHLMHGTRQIRIVGSDTDTLDDGTTVRQPILPTGARVYDVLLFAVNNRIFATQVTALPLNNAIFNSWATLYSAVNSNLVGQNAGTIQGERFWDNAGTSFRQGNIYTTSHAPISFGGNQWLARHNNVTSTPGIGSDWFLMSPTWVVQDYPVGSIVRHDILGVERHWRAIADASSTVTPGTNSAIWYELPRVGREQIDIPEWDDVPDWVGGNWGEGHAVRVDNRYFVSLVANNTYNPLTSNTWQEFVAFDANVPVFVAGRVYPTGALVSYTTLGVEEFFIRTGINGASVTLPATGWARVQNWHSLTSIPQWSPSIANTGPGYATAGVLVEYNGLIFRRTTTPWGGSISPSGHANSHDIWEHILTVEETMGPLEWAGQASPPIGTIFRFSNNANHQRYFVTITANPHYSSPPHWTQTWAFRHVPQWAADRTFRTSLANWQYDPSHAYTFNTDGTRTFWRRIGSTEAVSGEANRPNSNSPHWEEIEFYFNYEGNYIISQSILEGRIIWRRVPNTPLLPPSEFGLNNSWARVDRSAVTDDFVYTLSDGGSVVVWRNDFSGANTTVPGTLGASWTRVYFYTGNTHVYTVSQGGGVHRFWYSSSASSAFPGLGSGDWVEIEIAGREYLPDYFWMPYENGNGLVTYFNILPCRAWNILDNAWIGSFNRVVNHWNVFNRYGVTGSDDIAVYGTSATHTYRYFRLRPGVGAVMGISPLSLEGRLVWEPVR